MGYVKRYLPNLAMMIIAIWVGMSSYLVVSKIMEEPEFDPWGDFSIQRIVHDDTDELLPVVPGVEHVFSISETKQIETTGVKCLSNEQDEVISVGGIVSWFMIVPPGFQHNSDVYEGTARMNPGCTSYEYSNTIPQDVLDEVNLKLETEPYVIMNIQGYSVPYVDGKEHGVRATWSTENFAFVR